MAQGSGSYCPFTPSPFSSSPQAQAHDCRAAEGGGRADEEVLGGTKEREEGAVSNGPLGGDRLVASKRLGYPARYSARSQRPHLSQ